MELKKRKNEILEALPVLKKLRQEHQELFLENGLFITIPKGGRVIYHEDSYRRVVPFLIRGNIRKYKISDNGKEFTLFTIAPGEFCFLSASRSSHAVEFPVFSEIEEGSIIFSVSREIFKELLSEQSWEEYVSELFSKKIIELMTTFSEAVFESIPQRVAKYLLRNNNKNLVQTTHERIAFELGSAREVITRILREFQNNGILLLSRGRINIVEREALERIAYEKK